MRPEGDGDAERVDTLEMLPIKVELIVDRLDEDELILKFSTFIMRHCRCTYEVNPKVEELLVLNAEGEFDDNDDTLCEVEKE